MNGYKILFAKKQGCEYEEIQKLKISHHTILNVSKKHESMFSHKYVSDSRVRCKGDKKPIMQWGYRLGFLTTIPAYLHAERGQLINEQAVVTDEAVIWK